VIRALLAVLALICGPAFAQDNQNPRLSPLVKDLTYGVYCADPPDRQAEAPGTAAGVVNMMDSLPEIRLQQTIVPAEYGIGFGVILNVAPDALYDPALVTITHPPYPDSGIEVEQWFTTIGGGTGDLVGFSFETASELVPGTWTFTAEYEGAELFHIEFEVVPAALLPDVAQMCSGAFLS